MTVTVFVPDVPEFLPLVHAAAKVDGCAVKSSQGGYWRLESPRSLLFSRKALGLGPALWNSALSGGFVGRIVKYDRDTMIIESED